MRMTRYDRIAQLSFMPRLFPVNCYLVEEEDGLTLVDAALPFSVKGILETAKAMGKPLRRIVLTHAHSDHIGAADKLKVLLPGAELYVSAREAKLLAGDRMLEPGEPETPVKGGVPKPGQFRTVPDVLLNDGDRIGSLQAVMAPGHTPGQMAFLDTRNGAILAGDAFQTRGGIAVSGKLMPWFPFPALATWSKAEALASAKRLLALNPSVLAAGHGPMLHDPEEAMKRAIQEAEQALSAMNARRS
jgi:glyoxylase-like metal-dependent hydrolase (beta-lactamase superfamily II)